jgi:hypothetical protein
VLFFVVVFVFVFEVVLDFFVVVEVGFAFLLFRSQLTLNLGGDRLIIALLVVEGAGVVEGVGLIVVDGFVVEVGFEVDFIVDFLVDFIVVGFGGHGFHGG